MYSAKKHFSEIKFEGNQVLDICFIDIYGFVFTDAGIVYEYEDNRFDHGTFYLIKETSIHIFIYIATFQIAWKIETIKHVKISTFTLWKIGNKIQH